MRVGVYLRWGAFIGAIILAGIVAFDRSPDQATATFIGQLFIFLPPVAMVAVGGTRTRKGAGTVALVTLVMMLVLDFSPIQGVGGAGAIPGFGVAPGGALIESSPENEWLRPGAIAVAFEILPEAALLRVDSSRDYYIDSDVAIAAQTLLKLAYFLVPFGLIGWTLGLEAWMRKRVTFARPRDALAARVFLDVGIGMFAVWFSFNTAFRAIAGIVFDGDPVWSVTIPMLLVFTTGLPGWFQPRGDDDLSLDRL